MYYLHINVNINYDICRNIQKFQKIVFSKKFSKKKIFVKENRESVWNNIQEYSILFSYMES
jgi:hypothetical protein